MGSSRNAKIAVVDDDLRVLEAMQELLTSAGHQVQLFSSAQLMLDANILSGIDCLITDIGMPRIDGFELLHQARSSRPDLPVIFITARDEPTDLKRASIGGHQGFFFKPFNASDLLNAISRATQTPLAKR
jgi:FixJ family two-component response regulator